ncbi:MAG: addiction module antitoxin RelB [Acidobacteria bacterium]|nr:addiction module antitoxin RelB [Acidobacteriota bacterium]
MGIEELKEELFRLGPEDRANLARLDTLTESEIEELWLQEAIRRDEELDKGNAHSYSAGEVFNRARARRE